jgi:CubicO group peptidase (beta-lactamase class C family)
LLLDCLHLFNRYLVKLGFLKRLSYNFVDIDDNDIFIQRKLEAGIAQPWPLASTYNKQTLDTNTANELSRERSVAYLVIHHDSLVYEAYWDGYSDSSLSNSFSMSKSVIGMLTGVAMKEGKIKSLNQTVGEFIPEYASNSKGKLTLRNLITMSAALSWDEAYTSCLALQQKPITEKI